MVGQLLGRNDFESARWVGRKMFSGSLLLGAASGLVCDTIAMWGVILPAGYIVAFVLGLPPIVVYAVMCMDEFVKLPFVAHRFRKYRWLKNLTGEEAPEE